MILMIRPGNNCILDARRTWVMIMHHGPFSLCCIKLSVKHKLQICKVMILLIFIDPGRVR